MNDGNLTEKTSPENDFGGTPELRINTGPDTELLAPPTSKALAEALGVLAERATPQQTPNSTPTDKGPSSSKRDPAEPNLWPF